jgi:hypothetical protein
MLFKTTQLIVLAGGLTVGVAVYAVLSERKRRRIHYEEQLLKARSMQKAVEDMAAHAKSFIGLYEPLRMIRDGKLQSGKDVFADWDTRVGNMENASALKRYWSEEYGDFIEWSEQKAAKKADILLKFSEQAGIERGRETEVTVGRDVFRRYITKDGARIEPGAVASVVTPYWANGSEILEKGIITVKQGGNENE